MGVCNFAASYITWDNISMPRQPDPRPYGRHQPWGNSARLKIDSIVDLIDETSGATERFYLIAPCRTEWMYVDEKIFARHPDHNREYRVIFGNDEQRSVGKGFLADEQQSRRSTVSEFFNSFKITERTLSNARALRTDDEIIEATLKDDILVGRTELRDVSRNQRVVLEYPVHTMNIHPPRHRFQVDTGPLIVPDFGSQSEHAIERLELAHVVYNRLDKAEFILRLPTPILKDGQEVARVVDYQDAREYAARNEIFASAL